LLALVKLRLKRKIKNKIEEKKKDKMKGVYSAESAANLSFQELNKQIVYWL